MVFRLIIKLIVFSVILVLICYASLHINPDYKEEYVAAVVPKLEKLKATKVKKIVVIGGSNASFGIDTDLMEERLGLPVVNMALHGGLPVKFIIEQVKRHLYEGDILILSKEYSGLKDQYWNNMNGVELPKIVTYDKSQFYVLASDIKLFESTISGIFNTIKHYIAKYPIPSKRSKKSVYRLDAFRADNIKSSYIDGKYEREIELHTLPAIDKNPILLKGLQEYDTYFERKGVQFYITPPVIINGYYDSEEIIPFWKSLSEKTGIEMLNNKKNYSYDKKYFYNSHYHTNSEGREIRTESLIEDMSGKLGLFPKKRDKPIYVGNKKSFNLASIDDFDKMRSFEVIKRDSIGLHVKQSGPLTHNYFRMQFKNTDYKGYNFYLKLNCDSTLLNNLRFRGVGKKEQFDTIISLGNNNFELWKEVDDVHFKDNNSYIGITLLNNYSAKNGQFTIKDTGVFEKLGLNDSFKERYLLSPGNEMIKYFKVLSNNEKVRLSDIIESAKVNGRTELLANRLYKIEKANNGLKIVDFYTNETILEVNKGLSFKNSHENMVKLVF